MKNTISAMDELDAILQKLGFKQATQPGQSVSRFDYVQPSEELHLTLNSRYRPRKLPLALKCGKCEKKSLDFAYYRNYKCLNCGHNKATKIHLTDEEKKRLIDENINGKD
jgi:hypothetical protein